MTSRLPSRNFAASNPETLKFFFVLRTMIVHLAYTNLVMKTRIDGNFFCMITSSIKIQCQLNNNSVERRNVKNPTGSNHDTKRESDISLLFSYISGTFLKQDLGISICLNARSSTTDSLCFLFMHRSKKIKKNRILLES